MCCGRIQFNKEIGYHWKQTHTIQLGRGIQFRSRIDLLGAKSDVIFTHMEYDYDPWEKDKESHEANLRNKLLPWQSPFLGDIPENKKELICLKQRFSFHYANMMSAHIRIGFGLQIVLVCLYSTPSHYHHCTNYSKSIEITKCLPDIFCRVCE